ncbi:MAG: hypothetical protein K0S86_5111, partial [Geminicoccaceae bacterium]|nr:hypothetical protein [Geminicoccaceae bacterium]
SARLYNARIPCPPREPCQAAALGEWGDLANWTLFASQLEVAIRRVYDELDGKLPP